MELQKRVFQHEEEQEGSPSWQERVNSSKLFKAAGAESGSGGVSWEQIKKGLISQVRF